MTATVHAVHRAEHHTFGKRSHDEIELVAGLGVRGDAHAGATVRHRSRVRVDPTRPNLRQVHLIGAELFDELRMDGVDVAPGELGENVTTAGIDLHALATGTVLRLGGSALVALTGLRNPCGQIEAFRTGLLDVVRRRGDDGEVEYRAGVMSVVILGGIVRRNDPIEVAPPPSPPVPLRRV